jgi:pimeloyl-ACP methyl ester carboxylesterase
MSKQSKINGVQLYWERTGDSGEPLVFVHGSWVDHHSWDAVVPALSQSFRVLTYDRRGHSQSERPTTQGSTRDDMADLAALIEELGLAPAHIIGNSFGGLIVLRLAVERPDLFRSLIVNEPPLFGVLADEPDKQAMLQAVKAGIDGVVELLEAGDMEGGVRQFVEIIFGPGMWEQIPSELKNTVIFNAPTFLDEMHDPEALSIDLGRLRRFPHPALLTLGEQGPPFFKPIVEKIATALPQAERKTFLGVGHEPEYEAPERYVATIGEFITRVASAQKDSTA